MTGVSDYPAVVLPGFGVMRSQCHCAGNIESQGVACERLGTQRGVEGDPQRQMQT
jgi:hypothetical protein